MTVGDVYLDYPDVARINVYRKLGRKFVGKRQSQGRFYSTFITPEAKAMLSEYLKERRLSGEKISESSPLVTDVYHKGTFVSVEAFERVWARLLQRSGLNQKASKWYIYHVHTLRKYFRSNCVGVDPSYRENWMGHKGGYLDESYFKAEEEKHLAKYRKAIPHLSIHAAIIEEQQRRKQTLLDFARIQGWNEERLRRLDEVLARAKNADDAIEEFRRLQENPDTHKSNNQVKIVCGDHALIEHIGEGWTLIKELNQDRYLLKAS